MASPTGVISIRGNIAGVSNAYPGVVTSTAHGLSNNNQIKITEVAGMENFNNKVYRIKNVPANTFELFDAATNEKIDTTDLETYTSGGMWNRVDRIGSDRVFYNP